MSEQQLRHIIFDSEPSVAILQAARQVDLPNWYIGAGMLRNLVWDTLHGFESPTPLNDVDVAFFDASDLSRERDEKANLALTAVLPTIEWEATNQAAIHTWHEAYFGYPIEPYVSSEDGITSWPETATAVAVRLLPDNALKIFAPFGLEDLFTMTLRRNRTKVTIEEFRQRYQKKRIAEKWPLVRIVEE